MQSILIASKNPVKVQATLNGFQRMFPEERFQIQSTPATSGVGDQPRSDEETLLGATNRAKNAARNHPQANFWVGIEGGIQETNGEMTAFAWVVIYDGILLGKSRTGTFFLPPRVSSLVHQGVELGEADDIIFQRENSKQENGAIGILTANVIDRTGLYEQAVILALLPFKNPSLYPESALETSAFFSRSKDGYTLSTDPSLLNREIIHDFLSNRAYWSMGVPLETVNKAIRNSLPFGVYKDGKQIGFARVISDFATFAFLADVFILEQHRQAGLGKWLVDCILQHPQLQHLRRWILATRDAHDLYRPFGFKSLVKPEKWMERSDLQPRT
jgi:inosine/xanthosine triphosphatase